MKHVYIRPHSPHLNGKVERSHRTDQTEFYQRLTYTDDVDLNVKLEAWESFYNNGRPPKSLDEKIPYEVMRSLLKRNSFTFDQIDSIRLGPVKRFYSPAEVKIKSLFLR